VIEKLDELSNSKDYIDISISNSLLISNRKLRRKLEVILEKSGFSSVDYIDDIVLGTEEQRKMMLLNLMRVLWIYPFS
jgi:hypothetical protein